MPTTATLTITQYDPLNYQSIAFPSKILHSTHQQPRSSEPINITVHTSVHTPLSFTRPDMNASFQKGPRHNSQPKTLYQLNKESN